MNGETVIKTKTANPFKAMADYNWSSVPVDRTFSPEEEEDLDEE